MAKILILTFSFILFAASDLNINLKTNSTADPMSDQRTTTYYLIRHAEKIISATDKDPVLTEEGVVRAAKWAEFFQDVELDEIYSTNYKRTNSTATPTAESKNLVVKYYAPKDLLSDQFKKSTKGKTVLVVGHSNTIPFLANFLIQEEKYPELDESEYSWLYKISLDANGKATSEARKIE